jgi:hypothetical protein
MIREKYDSKKRESSTCERTVQNLDTVIDIAYFCKWLSVNSWVEVKGDLKFSL